MCSSDLGGACAPATVRAREGWTEPLVIWTCSVAPPGARKSPVLKLLRAPADEVERELRTDDRRRSELERASLLAELNAKDRRQRADAEARLRDLDNPLVFVTSGDATPEVLVDLLTRGQVHGLTVASAEGVILQHMAGLYKDGAANLDVYLQAHGGEPVKVHRKHQPLVEIARPLLALALATQPVTVFDARANRQIAGREIGRAHV